MFDVSARIQVWEVIEVSELFWNGIHMILQHYSLIRDV